MLIVHIETIVFFLGNKFKFSSAVLIFGSRSMVALIITHHQEYKNSRIQQWKSKLKMQFEGIRAVLRHRDNYVFITLRKDMT